MPLAGHDYNDQPWLEYLIISTPMPLAGHDVFQVIQDAGLEDFYSHAPRGA